jgi:hypothetical protein
MDKLVSYNFMHKSNQYYISAYLHPSKNHDHFSHMIEAVSAAQAQVLGTSILRLAARCHHQNVSIWPMLKSAAAEVMRAQPTMAVGARERMWAFSDVGLVARAAFIISWLRTK